MEIESDGRRVALVIRWANKRFSRFYLLQLSTAQLGLSVLEFRDADYSNRRRDYLRVKPQEAAVGSTRCGMHQLKGRCASIPTSARSSNIS
jgi:hypothetical protein